MSLLSRHYLTKFNIFKIVQLSSASYCYSSFNGVIPDESVEKWYLQNAQKNASKVEIRFKINEADWLPEELKAPLRNRLQNTMNPNGEVIIASDQYPRQDLNVVDCFDKLRATIYDVDQEVSSRSSVKSHSKPKRSFAPSIFDRPCEDAYNIFCASRDRNLDVATGTSAEIILLSTFSKVYEEIRQEQNVSDGEWEAQSSNQ